MVKASHCFNLLDARHAVSVTERQRSYAGPDTGRGVAEGYRDSREALGFPLPKHVLPEVAYDGAPIYCLNWARKNCRRAHC